MKLGNNLNGSYYELQNVRLQNLSADPTFNSSYTGLIYQKTGKVYYNNGITHVMLRDSGTQLVNGDIASNAAIDLSKLAVNPLARANHTGTQLSSTISDFNAAANTALASALSANSTADRARANHTGTQLSSTISDFSTAVNAVVGDKVDKSAASNLQVYVKNGSGVVTGVSYSVLSNPSTIPLRDANGNIQVGHPPSNSSDATSKAYVDSAVAGVRPRQSVVAASTANVSLTGYPIIDGVQSNQGLRFLLKNQTNPAQNGIYETSVSGTLVRAPDADEWYELVSAFVFVQRGDTNADTGWVCTADDDGSTIDVDPNEWIQFSAAGQIFAGSGLQKVGDTISIAPLGIVNGMVNNDAIRATKLSPTVISSDVNGDGKGLIWKDNGIAGFGANIQVSVDGSTIDFMTSPVSGERGQGAYPIAIKDGGVVLSGAKVAGTLPITRGGTGATTVAAARTALSAVGKYSSSTHGAGTTISIPAATHGLGATMALDVVTRIAATGERVYADDTVAANGNVTITFGASQAANTILVIIQG